jgi:hypothetical protein
LPPRNLNPEEQINRTDEALCLGNFSLKTTCPIGKDKVDDVKAGRCIAGIQMERKH